MQVSVGFSITRIAPRPAENLNAALTLHCAMAGVILKNFVLMSAFNSKEPNSPPNRRGCIHLFSILRDNPCLSFCGWATVVFEGIRDVVLLRLSIQVDVALLQECALSAPEYQTPFSLCYSSPVSDPDHDLQILSVKRLPFNGDRVPLDPNLHISWMHGREGRRMPARCSAFSPNIVGEAEPVRNSWMKCDVGLWTYLKLPSLVESMRHLTHTWIQLLGPRTVL